MTTKQLPEREVRIQRRWQGNYWFVSKNGQSGVLLSACGDFLGPRFPGLATLVPRNTDRQVMVSVRVLDKFTEGRKNTKNVFYTQLYLQRGYECNYFMYDKRKQSLVSLYQPAYRYLGLKAKDFPKYAYIPVEIKIKVLGKGQKS